MKRKSTKNHLKNLFIGTAKKIATIDANTACAFFSYQDIQPEEVKKLRKF